jgi:hypothetical protein
MLDPTKQVRTDGNENVWVLAKLFDNPFCQKTVYFTALVGLGNVGDGR